MSKNYHFKADSNQVLICIMGFKWVRSEVDNAERKKNFLARSYEMIDFF